MAALRRSKREANAVKLSNGRDYLAGKLCMTRKQLEKFLGSPKVLPHLVLWSKLCIDGPRRYNDACEWVNFLDGKYYEDGGELEEDLLLACLGEGQLMSIDDEKQVAQRSIFADHNASTASWCTQDLWARAAWRIAHDNCAPGDIFQHGIRHHPAAVYAVVIDILCLAFSSIASRPPELSCWYNLINDNSIQEKTAAVLTEVTAYATAQAIALDHMSDTESCVDAGMEDAEFSNDETSAFETSSESIESEFIDPESPFTKDTSVSSSSQVTLARSHKKKVEAVSGNEAVEHWMDSLWSIGDEAGVDAAFSMMDEEGLPITGYRRATRATTVQKPVTEVDSSLNHPDDDEIVVAGKRARAIYDSDDDEIFVANKKIRTVYDSDNDEIVVANARSSTAFDSENDEIVVASTK